MFLLQLKIKNKKCVRYNLCYISLFLLKRVAVTTVGMLVVCPSSGIWEGYLTLPGTAVAQWLRYCATNRKVAGSIPDGVIGIFH
jgi:hypothetical protein